MTGPLILPCNGKTPRVHRTAFVAPGAVLIGDVEVGPGASVYYGAVLRGDTTPIRVGARSNVQDNVVIHADPGHPTTLGEDVTVGHMAMLHGTTVEDGSLVGMSAVLLNGSRIGSGSLVAAGSVVLEGQVVPPRSLVAGLPAKVRRELSQEEAEGFVVHAGRYMENSARQPKPSEALPLEDVWFE